MDLVTSNASVFLEEVVSVVFTYPIQRKKWNKKVTPLQINDVVIMSMHDSPPAQWALGRILELHAGKDGVPKVATLSTSFGKFTHPINKLAPLVRC